MTSLSFNPARLLPDVAALAMAAGRAIMAIYQTDFAVTAKDDRSPVTAADLAAEALILEGLAQLTPELPVVAEEVAAAGRLPAGDPGQWGAFWLVDPLDGTKEFVKRNGEFTVNIALVVDGTPLLGVVHTPVRNWLHQGCGPGTASVVRDGGPARPIAVRPAPAQGLTVVASRSHRAYGTEQYLASLKIDTVVAAGSSLKFCLGAEGQADLYPRLGPTCEWDTAAGHAVVLAAGGTVKTFDGDPLRYGKPGFLNPFFVVKGG